MLGKLPLDAVPNLPDIKSEPVLGVRPTGLDCSHDGRNEEDFDEVVAIAEDVGILQVGASGRFCSTAH
jgi:hypothetical protein